MLFSTAVNAKWTVKCRISAMVWHFYKTRLSFTRIKHTIWTMCHAIATQGFSQERCWGANRDFLKFREGNNLHVATRLFSFHVFMGFQFTRTYWVPVLLKHLLNQKHACFHLWHRLLPLTSTLCQTRLHGVCGTFCLKITGNPSAMFFFNILCLSQKPHPAFFTL